MLRHALLTLLFAAWLAVPAPAQDFTARLVVDLTIGDDESKPLEYLFTSPKHIATDSEGRIYVADDNEQSISVFDSEGSFLKRVGESGEGPGEFRQLRNMAIGPDDALVIVDPMNNRITRISDFGETIDTYPWPEEQIVTVDWIGSLGESGYLLYYRILQDWRGSNPEEDELLHRYSLEFEPVHSFGTGDEFYDLSGSLEHRLPGSPSAFRLSTCGADCVLIAPGFYSGEIYRYERSENGSWQKMALEGYLPPTAPYEEADQDVEWETLAQQSAYPLMSFSGYRVYSLSRSLGGVKLSDGRIAHFSYMYHDDEQVYGLELFDVDGTFLGYGPVAVIGLDGEDWTDGLQVHWVDEQGRLYLCTTKDGFPAIHRARLDINH